MIGKIIGVIFALGLLAFSLGFLYQNLPGEPRELSIGTEIKSPKIDVDYGATPVFMENLRFNHNNLSFFIEPDCPKRKENSIFEAFEIIGGEGILSFYSSSGGDVDIFAGCSDDYIELGENLFVAGEGGPSEIINTSLFNVIRRGKISLYEDPSCDYPVVAIHEILHALGFDHSPDPENIMYNLSNCDQRITPEIIDTLRKLYSIEPLADLLISNLSATTSGRYLDYNITIRNQGLVDSGNTELVISSEGERIESMDIQEIPAGAGITLKVTNLRMFSRRIEEIDFSIDPENNLDELDKVNNNIKMILGQ
jgi:hypothetical protein